MTICLLYGTCGVAVAARLPIPVGGIAEHIDAEVVVSNDEIGLASVSSMPEIVGALVTHHRAIGQTPWAHTQ